MIICLSLTVNIVAAQLLVLPTEFIITTPKIGLLSEFQTIPFYAVSRKNAALEDSFNLILQESMSAWFDDTYEDVKHYDESDQVINFSKFQRNVKQEQTVYEMLQTKPLFGYSGDVPTEGVLLKADANKLYEKYETPYIVYTCVVSLYAPSQFGIEDPSKFRGHLHGYSWIIDAKTGIILYEAKINSRQKIARNEYNRSSYIPHYFTVHKERVTNFIENLQVKLDRQMMKL